MAVAGGSAPSLLLSWDGNRAIIEHGENRLIKIKDETTKKMVPTGAVELDLDKARADLAKNGRVWIRAQDRIRLGIDTIPRALLNGHRGRGSGRY